MRSKKSSMSLLKANAKLDEAGKLIEPLVACRKGSDTVMVPPDQATLMDVSPKQLVSVASSLIPFLENDDANRADGFEHAAPGSTSDESGCSIGRYRHGAQCCT